MSKLTGKVAVVTGASKGIGAEIARRLAAEGAAVVVNYASSREGADKVVADIEGAGGKAVAVQGNVATAADVNRIFAEAKSAFGTVDILVNNAGVYRFNTIEEVTEDEFHRQFDINVLGLLLATKAAVAQFGPDGGSVINISSVVSRLTPPGASIYAGTKAAVDAITRVLAKELGPRKIRVNAINPGGVETEGTHTAGISRQRLRSADGATDAAWPLGTARRYRTRRGVSRLRRLSLGDRRNPGRLRRYVVSARGRSNRWNCAAINQVFCAWDRAAPHATMRRGPGLLCGFAVPACRPRRSGRHPQAAATGCAPAE